MNWAEKIGPYTHKVIQRIFERLQLKEQGYQACLSVLNLSKKHSTEALEKACQIALDRLHSPRYRQLNAILTNPINKEILEEAERSQNESMGFVRGPEYYGGDQK